MKWLKSLVLLVVVLLAFGLALLGSTSNTEEVTLNFAVWETPRSLPIYWWLLIAFVIGITLGFVNAVWLNLKYRVEVRKLKQNLAQTTAEVERLRALSVQG